MRIIPNPAGHIFNVVGLADTAYVFDVRTIKIDKHEITFSCSDVREMSPFGPVMGLLRLSRGLGKKFYTAGMENGTHILCLMPSGYQAVIHECELQDQE